MSSPPLDSVPSPMADVLLHDGTIASIRPTVPSDIDALRELHTQLGSEGYRRRFFGTGAALAEDYLRHLATAPDVIALVAVRGGRTVALATAEPAGEALAEISFVVAEDCHGLGLGSLLLEHLAAKGRARGFVRFAAEVMTENREMLDVFAHAGFAEAHRTDRGTVELSMATDLTALALATADAKERVAETESLRPLLDPRSVAVVGVRSDGTGVGAAILRSIVEGGFAGGIVVVHPRLAGVEGIGVWRSFAEIPEQVDLALVAVPARDVLDVLSDAAAAGVRAAVVVSSGFEELGAGGRLAQRSMLDLARRHSMRVVGPNCLGVVLRTPERLLDATFGDRVPPAGGVAVASQSGGVGIALLDAAADLALGLRYFISLGNKVDVSSNDLLAAWTDDDGVEAAALYLESFGNPRKFARVARTFSERKPLLAVVGGRSGGGTRAGASHTAAAASPAVHVGALFAQAGVLACASAEEMAEAALMLTRQPLPAGRRVAIVTNAGGLGVIAADAADGVQLEVPEFSEGLRASLARHVGGLAGTGNPVDAGAGAGADQLGVLTEEILASEEVDALVAVVVPTRISDGASAVRRLLALARKPRRKPMAVVAVGSLWTRTWTPGSPTYPSLEAALRALALAATYAAWRREPAGGSPPLNHARARAAAAVAQTAGRAHPNGQNWLNATMIETLLTPYGLTPIGVVAHGADEAAAAAARIGFPVAVKAGSGDVVHKTERGLVRLGLRGVEEVRAAVRQMEELLGGEDTSVVVQPMSTGAEIALGVVRDDRFGPLVMVAAGGIHTEVWQDRTFLMPPFGRDAAARAVRALRVFPVLAGHRGSPPADVEHLMDLILQIELLVEEVPDLAELDINPVHVDARGCRIIDVKVRFAQGPTLDAGVPRRLRDR